MLGKTNDKLIDKYFKAVKSAKDIGERLLSDEFLVPIPALLQTKTMHSIANQSRV